MRVLIDTSFILPALGIDVGEEVLENIKKFPNHEIYFTDFSIIEAMWVMKKLIRRGEKIDYNSVKIGLKSLFNTYKLVKIPRLAYIKALKDDRHKDLIDLLLYYTASIYGMKFLTLDEKLRELDDKGIIVSKL
ncbi:PIN domain-containing protein [Saccharolobus caldissimus]|uniref:PIN domain-containing protein n=1 Tax=Saccharolobus caldissimus TaxID=1702097 RepID=A0AAQ4CRW6_9CREN|nr:PIN domain-containing protein [Saccharolobus caldissimus]BDB98547.1 PIN domain-containing protein [Saccharolobus caldissimus]